MFELNENLEVKEDNLLGFVNDSINNKAEPIVTNSKIPLNIFISNMPIN